VELSAQGEADEALASFRRAAELEPRTADMHVNLGNAWLTMGELDEAVACYRRALELDPRSTTAHDYLGMALARQGHAEEALASFRRASELDPRFAQAHANAGEVLVALGRPEEAALSFGRALELAPRNPNNHNNLGQALILQGKWDEAAASLRRAIEVDPGFAPAHVNLGLALVRSGELEEALDAYREAEALFALDSSAFGRQWHEAAGRSADELELRIERVPELDEVLAGRRAASSEEWNLAVQHGYDRRRHADVVALTERTLQDAPELIDDVLGLYNSACSAALLDARSAASVDDAERARARGLARAWLGREVERWVAVRDRAGSDAAAALGSLEHALEDPDFATVRGAALEGLPASEQAAWRELWERIEDAVAR
jgi:tetratricopeptide (TPR) repeat protein